MVEMIVGDRRFRTAQTDECFAVSLFPHKRTCTKVRRAKSFIWGSADTRFCSRLTSQCITTHRSLRSVSCDCSTAQRGLAFTVLHFRTRSQAQKYCGTVCACAHGVMVEFSPPSNQLHCDHSSVARLIIKNGFWLPSSVSPIDRLQTSSEFRTSELHAC